MSAPAFDRIELDDSSCLLEQAKAILNIVAEHLPDNEMGEALYGVASILDVAKKKLDGQVKALINAEVVQA